jgi:hypothetical protein
MADWTCPSCGQQFLRRNQSHSCQTQDVEMLFAGYPAAVSLYRHVRKSLEGLGPVEMAITKTQVSFRAQRGLRFCWMWCPPEGVKGVPDEAVVLTFDLPHPLGVPAHPACRRAAAREVHAPSGDGQSGPVGR